MNLLRTPHNLASLGPLHPRYPKVTPETGGECEAWAAGGGLHVPSLLRASRAGQHLILPVHCHPPFSAKVNPHQKLSAYECRETIGLFRILKWTISVGIDLSKKSWLAVQSRLLIEFISESRPFQRSPVQIEEIYRL